MQEHAVRDGAEVHVRQPPKAGQHIRRRGEELTAGTEALPAGRVLDPADLALAAACGAASLRVYRRPHVAVHPIGGLADKSSLKQTRDFVRATKACGVFGASLYDFSTTRGGQWPWLARIPQRRQAPRPSCS